MEPLQALKGAQENSFVNILLILSP